MSENECNVNASLLSRLECILSYAGSNGDVVINYTLLALNVVSAFHLVRLQSSPMRRDSAAKNMYQMGVIASFVFVILFQVILCLIVGCAGISIIWCAIAGWILSERKDVANYGRANPNDTHFWLAGEVFTLVLDFIVIVYYAIAFKPITTVAHVLAIIMGAVLSVASQKYQQQQQANLNAAATSSTSLLTN